jgi:hypothetical protein
MARRSGTMQQQDIRAFARDLHMIIGAIERDEATAFSQWPNV